MKIILFLLIWVAGYIITFAGAFVLISLFDNKLPDVENFRDFLDDITDNDIFISGLVHGSFLIIWPLPLFLEVVLGVVVVPGMLIRKFFSIILDALERIRW